MAQVIISAYEASPHAFFREVFFFDDVGSSSRGDKE